MSHETVQLQMALLREILNNPSAWKRSESEQNEADRQNAAAEARAERWANEQL